VLAQAQLAPEVRFIVLFSADELERGDGGYYESIDLMDAFHPQTLLAYELNGRPLPVANGAPLRLRVERQLGYKQAKYLMRIEAVARLDGIGGGKGGYWEDRGYEWYAGI
jgi:DMSO/TMAO reductase YedYZ molybdopterin-dependent catalytic subunit